LFSKRVKRKKLFCKKSKGRKFCEKIQRASQAQFFAVIFHWINLINFLDLIMGIKPELGFLHGMLRSNAIRKNYKKVFVSSI